MPASPPIINSLAETTKYLKIVGAGFLKQDSKEIKIFSKAR